MSAGFGVTLVTSTVCEIPIKELHMLCIKMPGLQRQVATRVR